MASFEETRRAAIAEVAGEEVTDESARAAQTEPWVVPPGIEVQEDSFGEDGWLKPGGIVIDLAEQEAEWVRYLHSLHAYAASRGMRVEDLPPEVVAAWRRAQLEAAGELPEEEEEFRADEPLSLVDELLRKAEWQEEDHPRDERGRFTHKPDAGRTEGGASGPGAAERGGTRSTPHGSDRSAALRREDPHAPGGVWADAERRYSRYGVVVVDPASKKVLLREPTNHFDGFHWTFARGGADPGEHPVDTAKREGKEELGYDLNILEPVPKVFRGARRWASLYYLATPAGEQGQPSWETAQTRWVTFDEARELIRQSENIPGRDRDLRVLDEVERMVMGRKAESPAAQRKSSMPPVSFLMVEVDDDEDLVAKGEVRVRGYTRINPRTGEMIEVSEYTREGNPVMEETEYGITSGRPGHQDPVEIERDLEVAVEQLERAGLQVTRHNLGEGGWVQGEEVMAEPAWILAIRHGDEPRALAEIAKVAKTYDQDAVLVRTPTVDIDAPDTTIHTKISFSGEIGDNERKEIAALCRDMGFGGWTYDPRTRSLGLTAVPQWGGDPGRHQEMTLALVRELWNRGLRFEAVIIPVKVNVIERGEYDAYIARGIRAR